MARFERAEENLGRGINGTESSILGLNEGNPSFESEKFCEKKS